MENSFSYIPESRAFHGSIPHVMGTRLDMLVCDVAERPGRDIWENVCGNLMGMDGLMDRFSPESEVYRINHGISTGLSEDLRTILEVCSGWWLRTAGLFDITRRDFSKLRWSTGAIDLGGMDLDFGGIGKGLALEYVKSLLADRGVTRAYVDFGGSSILAVGSHPYGPCWKTSLPNPYGGADLGEISLVDSSLSVSGNRPGYDSHIISPSGGQPCTDRKMVTVVCPSPLEAEVLSTAAMVASEEQMEMLRGNFPGAEIKIYQL